MKTTLLLTTTQLQWRPDAPIVVMVDMHLRSPLSAALSQPCITVQGSLKEHKSFWLNELEPFSFVAIIITEGYRLPFMRFADPVCQLNHNENYIFVCNAVEELVSTRCVVECDSCPIVSSPLSLVVNSGGKKRLVLDLTNSSQCINSSMKVWVSSHLCVVVEISSLILTSPPC